LLQETKGVHHHPLFSDLGIQKPEDVYIFEANRSARRGHTHELRPVRATSSEAAKYEIVLGRELLNIKVQIGERGKRPGDELPLGLGPYEALVPTFAQLARHSRGQARRVNAAAGR
jgi:hypothetical protein